MAKYGYWGDHTRAIKRWLKRSSKMLMGCRAARILNLSFMSWPRHPSFYDSTWCEKKSDGNSQVSKLWPRAKSSQFWCFCLAWPSLIPLACPALRSCTTITHFTNCRKQKADADLQPRYTFWQQPKYIFQGERTIRSGDGFTRRTNWKIVVAVSNCNAVCNSEWHFTTALCITCTPNFA